MNELVCHDLDELLAGYAFHALDEDEQCAVASHLAECRAHDVELQALRTDMERVAVAVTPVEPPAGLRSSLLDAFDREVAGSTVSAPETAPLRRPGGDGAAPSAGTGRLGIFSFGGLGYALAAALMVVAIGLGAWGASRSGDAGVLQATVTEGGDTMEVTYLEDRDIAVFEVDLSDLPAGMAYQAWQIVDDTPVSIGVLSTNTGSVAFTADLADASAIALSVEPEGGSEAPTTTPILVTSLRKS